MLAISGKAQNSTLEMEASQAHAFSLGFMGELQGAQTHCDRCLELFDPERAHGRLQAYSTDTASSVMCLASLVAWLRGFPDRAAALTDRALERAREVGHPYTSAWVLNFAAVIFSLRGEISRARQAAEACVRLAKQHDFPFWIAGGRVMSGWCRISAGERDEAALREVEEGLVDWRGTGAVVFSPYYLSGLVEGLRAVRPDASIEAALDEGIALIQTTGERWWEPELHRLRGALLQGAGPLTSTRDPEPFFSEAVRLARAKGSRSLELRAALSLGQWWSYRGRHDEARDLVAGVYDVFEEGFETTDLRAARLFIASHEGRGRA
jgi:adenylate cyclase